MANSELKQWCHQIIIKSGGKSTRIETTKAVEIKKFILLAAGIMPWD